MRRHSILFKINIVFAVAFAAVAVLTVATALFHARDEHRELFRGVHRIMKVLPPPQWVAQRAQLDTLAASHGIEIVGEPEKSRILASARPDGPPDMDPDFLPPLRPLREGGQPMLQFHDAHGDLLFRQVEGEERSLPLLPLLLVGVLGLLVVLYVLIRRSLAPLELLRTQIRTFGEGEPEKPRSQGRDEISTIYREFYRSAMRVRAMEEARRLFLRNVMHELNTPVAKGRIIAAMVEDRNKPILENIFERLEFLIRSLADTEKISSGSYEVKLHTYRVADIVDHALDLLFEEGGAIACDGCEAALVCDFELMSLAFKNLIDNALKYGSNAAVRVEKGSVHFSSVAAALEAPLKHYTEPFVKGEYEQLGSGFGLGLYIVSEVLERQGYLLGYAHHEGVNVFTVERRKCHADR